MAHCQGIQPWGLSKQEYHDRLIGFHLWEGFNPRGPVVAHGYHDHVHTMTLPRLP